MSAEKKLENILVNVCGERYLSQVKISVVIGELCQVSGDAEEQLSYF